MTKYHNRINIEKSKLGCFFESTLSIFNYQQVIMRYYIATTTVLLFTSFLHAQQRDIYIQNAVDKIESKCIAWRRDIHQNPELGNREFRTAKLVAAHLKSLGFEVNEGIAKTGVVGILKTNKTGPVIALRADMDALPVTERNELPFKSTIKTTYDGQQVGVMHACGHDTHV